MSQVESDIEQAGAEARAEANAAPAAAGGDPQRPSLMDEIEALLAEVNQGLDTLDALDQVPRESLDDRERAPDPDPDAEGPGEDEPSEAESAEAPQASEAGTTLDHPSGERVGERGSGGVRRTEDGVYLEADRPEPEREAIVERDGAKSPDEAGAIIDTGGDPSIEAIDEALAASMDEGVIECEIDVDEPAPEGASAEGLVEPEESAGAHVERAEPAPEAAPPPSAAAQPEAAAPAAAPAPEADKAAPSPAGAATEAAPSSKAGAAATAARAAWQRLIHVLSLPLMYLPPHVRDYIGWFGVVTLINAVGVWLVWALFRA